MRPVNAAIIGAIAGGLILIVGSIAVHMVNRSVPKHEPTPAPLPVYSHAIDICRKLHEAGVACLDVRSATQLVNNEIEAADAVVGNATSRISIYPSQKVTSRLLGSTNLRNANGQRLDVVAGENWTVTIVLPTAEGHDRAYVIQQVLGGVVVESKGE